MIEIVELSPCNEMPVARRLADLARAAWPDVASSRTDRVTILAGVEMFREIDLIVAIRLGSPRALPAMPRRDGSRSQDDYVQSAVLAIEVKQLDPGRFTARGTEIFPDYGDRAKHARSVNVQARDAATALRIWLSRYDMERPYVFGLGWLTEVDEAELAGVNPWILGNALRWPQLLDAAAQQSPSLYGNATPARLEAIDTMVRALTQRRAISPRDRARVNSLSNDVLAADVVAELAAIAGTKFVRIAGRGGSGKTTTLVLLAKHLAVVGGERVLILTFHKTLRSDIAHLIESTIDVPGIAGRKIVVESVMEFFIEAMRALGAIVPIKDDGAIDYPQLDAALDETRALLVGDAETGDAAALKRREPERFAYDYVLIDEAQDWTDAERDFLYALYGTTRLVVADGLEQLIRRPSPCDWFGGVLKAGRVSKHLGRSLRMTQNLATFANAAARASGLADWRIEPFADLPGGRIVIAIGGELDVVALHEAVRVLAAAGGAAPVDTLVCLPPRDRDYVARLEASGACVWDGTHLSVRDTVPPSDACWRAVRYDSCRGLEGWITIAHGLDALIDSKLRHPAGGAEPEAWERVASKWLMMAITRAVNTLVITIPDASSPLVPILRAASVEMPAGVVQWTDAGALPRVLA